MQFQAKNFVYDNIPSEEYGLTITSLDVGETVVSSGSSVSLVTDTIFKNPRHHLLGIKQNSPLEFDVEFTSETPLDKFDIDAIASWLTEQHSFKKLQIDQDDMLHIYYNCIITDMSNVYYCNKGYSFRCKVICDAPWAWEFERSWIRNYPTSSPNIDVFTNTSATNNFLRPVVEFKLTNNNTSFKIVNKTLDIEFSWFNLQPNETIWVDNDKQIIKSSTGFFRADNFNKHFFELAKNRNVLEFYGTVEYVKITYTNARKVGG